MLIILIKQKTILAWSLSFPFLYRKYDYSSISLTLVLLIIRICVHPTRSGNTSCLTIVQVCLRRTVTYVYTGAHRYIKQSASRRPQRHTHWASHNSWAPGHYPRSLQKSTDKTLVRSLVDTCLGWTPF